MRLEIKVSHLVKGQQGGGQMCREAGEGTGREGRAGADGGRIRGGSAQIRGRSRAAVGWIGGRWGAVQGKMGGIWGRLMGNRGERGRDAEAGQEVPSMSVTVPHLKGQICLPPSH